MFGNVTLSDASEGFIKTAHDLKRAFGLKSDGKLYYKSDDGTWQETGLEGVTAFALPRAAIRAKGAKRLAVTPDFATAKVGDAGYWVVPTGQYGTFRCERGDFSCSWPSMSMFGMKTPAKTYVALVKGLKYYFTARVTARDGVYRQSCVLNEEQCSAPYEDFAIEWRTLTGDAADYSGMARAYRAYQLERGAVKPFKEPHLMKNSDPPANQES